MIKRVIKETIEKYDKDGKLVEKITREETESDDETRYPLQGLTYPLNPNGTSVVNPGEPLTIKYGTNNPYVINCSSECKTSGE